MSDVAFIFAENGRSWMGEDSMPAVSGKSFLEQVVERTQDMSSLWGLIYGRLRKISRFHPSLATDERRFSPRRSKCANT